MNFPPPTEKQARVLWFSLTTLAIVLVLAIVGGLLWGLGWIIKQLSSVLLPLAMAGVLACLLDPLVDFFERQLKIPRLRAIALVFMLAVGLMLILLATVVPKLIYESSSLVGDLPATAEKLRVRIQVLLDQTPAGHKIRAEWDTHLGNDFQAWLGKAWPVAGAWIWQQLAKVASWFGLALGLALVPVYTFYFLLEKEGILKRWTDYLPMQESAVKTELVYILRAFNDCLVAFFRGQILVSLCSAILLTIGYLLLGLDYALLLGALAVCLGIVPYLGAIISVGLAVALAAVQFQDWLHPLVVIGLFCGVQCAEGLYYSPRIIGTRVGLHPVTIIIAVMVGTTLLGGILGGILAIPVTAALRSIMFRYVWKTSPA
ncbi:MAG: AI-2E family transporter [Verrucomicrobiota bacterium]